MEAEPSRSASAALLTITACNKEKDVVVVDNEASQMS